MRQLPADEYAGPRGVGIRMSEPQMPGLTSQYGPAADALLDTYHRFDKAHLVMLTEEGLIPREAGSAMLSALRHMEERGMTAVRNEVGGGMHSGEQYLIRRLGYDVGGRIHLGRSTGDFGAVSRRIRQRDRLLQLMRALNEARRGILALAPEHFETVMAGQTGGQHAQPTTLGHELLAWASALERHFERAQSTYERVNASPAGAAIMTGSSFALNRQRTADLLGFDSVLRNTFDAIQGHDDEFATVAVAAGVTLSLARWSNDINFWSGQEAGYVRIPDRFCGTSSIMAQKRNPAILPAIRTGASESLGAVVTTFASLNTMTGEFGGDGGAGLHLSFDRAVQGLGWLTELLPALEFDRERMLEEAGAHWAQATDLAAALVSERGWPWRIGHQVAAIVVRLSEDRGIAPRDVQLELVDEASMEYHDQPSGLSETVLREALDPTHFVRARTLYGGPSPEESRRRLPDYTTVLERDERAAEAISARLADADATLEAAIDAIVS
ncbi:MAG: argininosuccinate lyase [Dehalococcoidia bacterium]